MTIIFTIIFLLSLGLGWLFAHVNDMALWGYIASIATAGFLGSSLIALIFIGLYFFQKETDKERIERLKSEINEIKEVKRIGR